MPDETLSEAIHRPLSRPRRVVMLDELRTLPTLERIADADRASLADVGLDRDEAIALAQAAVDQALTYKSAFHFLDRHPRMARRR